MTPSTHPDKGYKTQFRSKLDVLLERNWFDLSLLTKMAALVTVGIAGLMAIFSLIGLNTTRQATQQVLNERVILARMSAMTMDAQLEHVTADLQLLARQPELQVLNNSSGYQAVLDRFGHMQQAIYFIAMDGRLLAGTRPLDSETGVSQQQAVLGALHGMSYAVSLFSVAPDEDPLAAPLAVVSVPVQDSQGRSIAALAAVIDLSDPSIFPMGGNFDLGESGTLDLVDDSGLVLLSTGAERMRGSSEQDQILSRLFAGQRPDVETCLACAEDEASRGSDEVIAFAPLEYAPWGVVVRQKALEVFSPVRAVKARILILGLLTTGGALVLVWVTTNSVIKPVQGLTEAATRIANGDLSTPLSKGLGSQRRRDEIGALAYSFGAMRRKLKRSIDEIQALNRDLDARVQERTQAALDAQMEAQVMRDDLRSIIDALSDQLVVVSVEDRRVRQVNRAVQQALAGSGSNGEGPSIVAESEIIGRPFSELFPCMQLNGNGGCECPIPEVIQRGESVQVTHIHPGDLPGEERYIDIVASPLYDAEGHITRVVELMRDVTEEKRMKESLIRRNQQLSILNAIALTANQSLDLDEILGRVLDEVLHLTDVDAGAVFLREDVLGTLDLVAYRGLSERAALLASQLGLLEGSCGGVVDHGQMVVVPDISRYRGRRANSLRREKLSALLHVPLTAKGATLGSMCVGTRKLRSFTPEEQELLTVIGTQIAASIENARLYAEVQHKEQLRGKLFKKAINAQEDERKRIARELHDDTSQALAALLFAAEEVTEMDNLQDVQARVEGMRELVQHTLDGVHKLIFDLRPTMLDHLGLVPALRWFAETRLSQHGVRVIVETATDEVRLPAEVETALFRAVQEAINNIARHAAARNVCVVLQFFDDRVTVSVEDDGIGFNLLEESFSVETGRGLGLLGMQERIELLGGALQISAELGSGTQIHIQVPLPKEV